MKFILFDVQDINKTNIGKIELDDNHYINEIIFSEKILNLLSKEPKNIWAKIKYKFYDMKTEKIILKALEKYNKKWHYILSKDIAVYSIYLNNKFEQLLGYKLPKTNEMDSNIFKYVDEYITKNKQLKSHELKVLVVVANVKNLNISLISNLIKKYKSVNIYLKEQPSEYLLKRIKQINKSEGTTIEIIKKERKSFGDYNIIYFADDYRKNYPRFRFGKNAILIDLEEAQQDKYNSNAIYLKEFLKKQETNLKNIQNLTKKYNYLELGALINKITNVLDKS